MVVSNSDTQELLKGVIETVITQDGRRGSVISMRRERVEICMTQGERGRAAVHSTSYRQTRRTGQGYVAGNTLFFSGNIQKEMKQAVTERAQHDGQRGERSSSRGTGFTFARPGTAREPAGWRWGNAPG